MIGTKNILLLVSALLMVSDVDCERGNVAQRMLNVGARPTAKPANEPSESPAPYYHGNSDDESGKGKGKGKGKGSDVPSNDESGKGKGQGTKAPSDDESGKGKGKGMDVPSDDDNQGKGKGKGMEIPSEDYDDYYGSYPPLVGKGKGKGKGLPKKSSKSDKKSKKEDKKEGKPTPNPAPTPSEPSSPVEPTSEPQPPSPTTPSPTSADSIPIRTLPYSLQYSNVTEVPGTSDFAQLAEVTRVYLEDFMVAEFSQTSLTNLDDFVTFMTRNEFNEGDPVVADYRSTGLFNPSSIFLPTVRELNGLVEEAFTNDNLSEYLKQVQALPSGNPFSQTKSIVYKQLDNSSSTTKESSSSFARAGVAAAAAGIVVLAAGLVVMRSRRNVNVEQESISPQKDVSGDSTVAGETCNMSLDGSSVAQWKAPTGFKNETEEDEEFEDEPLDSDEEDELPQPKTQPVSRLSS